MTEDEAKTKWCHQRIRGVGSNLTTEKSCSCIASGCMAWRWTLVANPAWKDDGFYASVGGRSNPYSATPTGAPSTTDGRCGIAGQ